jgi:hypothetical protein
MVREELVELRPDGPHGLFPLLHDHPTRPLTDDQAERLRKEDS